MQAPDDPARRAFRIGGTIIRQPLAQINADKHRFNGRKKTQKWGVFLQGQTEEMKICHDTMKDAETIFPIVNGTAFGIRPLPLGSPVFLSSMTEFEQQNSFAHCIRPTSQAETLGRKYFLMKRI